jgi:hypothetical protein
MGSREIWTFLFLLGLLFFNWPFLKIFEHSLPSYLFVLWAAFIVAIGVLINLVQKQKGP